MRTNKRVWNDAPQQCRCKATIQLKDKTTAQCGRKAVVGDYCKQHAKK